MVYKNLNNGYWITDFPREVVISKTRAPETASDKYLFLINFRMSKVNPPTNIKGKVVNKKVLA